VEEQMPFWRKQVGHVVDANTARSQIIHGFRARINRYFINDFIFTETAGDPIHLSRSVSRVSVDRPRGCAFHLTLTGGLGEATGASTKRSSKAVEQGIIAFDLDQPFVHERPAHRMLNFMVPKALVLESIVDIEALHAQVVDRASPLVGLAFEHMAALMHDMPRLSAEDAAKALSVGLRLIVASFNMDWRRNAMAREAAHQAIVHKMYRYIDAHLDEPGLNGRLLSKLFGVHIASLQRGFDKKQGVEGYILYKRLRAAADQLVRFPHRTIEDIAFSLAFKSPQDFEDKFTSAFGTRPQDARAEGLALKARSVFAA
jgi:AraC-like DNA-binding protein